MPGSVALFIVIIAAGMEVSSDLQSSLNACRTMTTDPDRLACYDAVMDARPAAELTSPSTDSATATDVPGAVDESPIVSGGPADAASEAEFGFEDRVRDAPGQLVSSVARTDRNARGGLVVTLSNGQVWQQTGGERLYLDPGETVYLFRGAMSAFYLSTSATGRRYRVSRLR